MCFFALRPAADALQSGLSCENAVVLRLFEDGDAAKVGIREEDAAVAWVSAREAAALFGKNRTDNGAGHGVAHAHNVDAGDALADVGVDALEVVEDGFLPIVPILIEKELAVLLGGAIGESPIKSPDGAIDVCAKTLVGSVDVAQRGGIEKDGAPGGFRAAGIGETLEREIGGKPGGVDEIVETWKTFDQIRSEECWRGEDYEFGLEFGVAGENADAAFGFGDAVDHLICADVFAYSFEETSRDPAVSFGPGERAFFFGFAGREIVDSSPGGGVFGERAVVVAAGVVHVPVHEARIAALLLEPIGKRKTIQILMLCGAAEIERNCEFAAGAEFCEKIFEMLKLVAIFLGEADGGFEAVLPAPVEEKAFLRRETEVALFPLAIFQDAKIFEEFADVFCLWAGDGDVMRGPGIGGDFVFAPASVAAGLGIHFQQNEIG